MIYTIRGRLHYLICDDQDVHPLANTVIRLYRAQSDNVSEYVTANVKETLKALDEKAIAAKAGNLLAETTTNANGEYEFKIDGDKTKYQGEPVEIDIYYGKIPSYGQPMHDNKKFKPFQVSITTFQPRWKETNNGLVAVWGYHMPPKSFCYILSLLDIWVICGVLTFCDSGARVPGIEVIAMDDDWIHDDELGRATTDANGRFYIWYTSREFKKTFLSPLINVETPFPPFNSGPDVYFKFAYNGAEFQPESPSMGKKPGRENVGNCLCVRLCIKPIDDFTPPDVIAAFFKIGKKREYHIVNNIDPVTGKTNNKPSASWNGKAFYSNLALIGSMTKEFNGNPMEYAFQVQQLDAPGGTVISAWADITPGQIANTVIGYTQQFISNPLDPEYPVKITDYALHAIGSQVNVPFNGNWIPVPQLANFIPNNNGVMIDLISRNLSPAWTNENMSNLIPGNSTTTAPSGSGSLLKNRYYQLRMLKREAGNPASQQIAGTSRTIAVFNTRYENVPQQGSWQPTTSTELGVACLDLKQLTTGGGCAKITTDLDINYTAANPNLGGVSLSLSGPGGPHAFDPVVFTTPGEEASGSASYLGNVSSLPKCAYIARISATLNLTDGEDNHNGIKDEVAFCK